MERGNILFVSLDAVDSGEFGEIMKMENVRSAIRGASFVRQVSSVFVSNTYPSHTSIVSGCNPNKHGVWDNLIFQAGSLKPDWHWQEKEIKVKTIIRAAKENSLKVATIFWPVTAGGDIKFNMPEIFANRKWQSQLMVSLLGGSKRYQIKMFLRHGKLLKGKEQPNLDNFIMECLKDTIKEKKADLTFVHLTDSDTNKHKYGASSQEGKDALKRHGERICEIVKTLKEAGTYDGTSIFIFGDHGMFDVSEEYSPNELLQKMGLCDIRGKKLVAWKALFQCCGGSAFLRIKEGEDREKIIEIVHKELEFMIKNGDVAIKRILSDDELFESGFSDVSPFGIETRLGVSFYEFEKGDYKGNHGYSLKNDGYKTSIIAVGKGIRESVDIMKGSLLDICPTAVKLLGIGGWEMEGKVIESILEK